ncbi:MAG TPA: TAXI family TRAP transporter solute-binding subunit [Xanthobacteraceae bacterium]|nr:TAXI family TRAP transporter solute-binding subunit [Xanthobacteraceae bacterium]
MVTTVDRAPVRIGTAEPDSTFLTQGLALKSLLDRRHELGEIEVCSSEHASIENANRLHRGDLEFGFMAANWIGRAKAGEPPFTHPIDLRMVAPMNSGPLFFIARSDSSLRSVADLRGKRIALGAARSGMVQHAHTIFGALGMSFSDFSPVYLDFAEGADALVAGDVDAQFQCPIPNKIMTALCGRIAVRVLPFGPGELDTVLRAVSFYRLSMMRRGSVPGLTTDLGQVGVVNVLVTHARVADDVVAAVARAVATGADDLPRLNPLFQGLGDLLAPLRTAGAAALEFGGVALHPGALAAYRDLGWLAAPAAVRP